MSTLTILHELYYNNTLMLLDESEIWIMTKILIMFSLNNFLISDSLYGILNWLFFNINFMLNYILTDFDLTSSFLIS